MDHLLLEEEGAILLPGLLAILYALVGSRLDEGVAVLLVGVAVFGGLGQVVTEGEGLLLLLFVELQLSGGLGDDLSDVVHGSIRHHQIQLLLFLLVYEVLHLLEVHLLGEFLVGVLAVGAPLLTTLPLAP